MPVDTREKRASAAGFLYTVLPLPDGAISQADRQQVTWVYAGITAEAPAPVVQVTTVTAAQLLDLEVLQRQESVRWELLDSTLAVIGELHPFLGATVEANTTAAYKRQLRNLTLLQSEWVDIDTFVSRVKAWWVLQTGDEYELGVFMFQDASRPQRTYGGPTVCGLLVDQTWILDQPRRSSFTIAAGAVLSDLLISLAAEAGITDLTGIEGSAVTASSTNAKPPGTSRLQIMSEICGLLGYYPPYFDKTGKLICRAVPVLDLATPDHEYHLGDRSRILADTVVVSDDAWKAPNEYVVFNGSATSAPIVGSYEIPSDAPNSELHRGFKVTKIINEPGVQDSTQAAELARAAYVKDDASFRWVSFDATPDPRHDLFDIVAYDELNHQEIGWSLPLQPGGSHHHQLQRIYS